MKQLKRMPGVYWAILAGCILISIFSYFRIFNNFELDTYDLRFAIRPAIKASEKIIIIEISDDTLANLGTWPLPRDFHESLVRVLKEYSARAIVFDILFSEQTLYDEEFAKSIKEAKNVYLPLAFHIDESKAKLFTVSNRLLGGVSANLEIYAKGIAHINIFVDPDGKVRRAPLFIKYKERLYPQMALKVFLDELNIDINNNYRRADKIVVGEKISIPVSSGASIIVNYPGKWGKSFRHISYFDILKAYNDKTKGIKPELDLSILNGKACFIGLTATGTSDLRPNPLEGTYPMLGLQAAVFNSLIQRNFILDAGRFANTIINLFIFAVTLLICLRLSPPRSFLINFISACGYFILATACFVFLNIWVDLFMPIATIASTYALVSLWRFINEIRKRELIEQELGIARAIQESFLPKDIKEFKNLRISSFMQPAKYVAGDLYDILPIDDRRIGIFIGDVSGKGVPASLIMAQTISLFRIFARQAYSPAEVLDNLNRELCGKFAGRFVTCIYIIIDTSDNKLLASSAGHGPLLICGSEGILNDLDLLPELPLGIMDNVKYKAIEFRLSEADKLCIFTDGLYEAYDKHGREFGLENIKKIFLQTYSLDPDKTLDSLKGRVLKFTYPRAQHDDITAIVAQVYKS